MMPLGGVRLSVAAGQHSSTVVACQPTSSLLYQKTALATPPIGVRMPADGPPYLTPSQQSAIEQWIAEGGRSSCAAPDPCSDAQAPTFAGVATATAVNATTVELCWPAATDNLTPAASLLYDAYAASAPGAEALTAPPTRTSAAGATCVDVAGLTPNQQYCWVARARDGAGNRDGNTVERCLTTAAATCIDYASVIQPIFNAECVQCHAGASPPRGLHLDSYGGVMAGGQR